MRVRLHTSILVPVLFCAGAVLTGTHAARVIGQAITHPSTRAWLDVAYAILRTGVAGAFAVFTIGRTAPRRPARGPLALAACAIAMGAVVMLGDPTSHTPRSLILCGDLVAVVSCAWLFVAVTFLGRCFGVLPEARGLVTTGPYARVRHPVYLGEIGAAVGLVIAAPSSGNGAVLCALVLAQSIRMRLEERALASAFSDYEDYARAVPRLLPFGRPGRVPAYRVRSFAPTSTEIGSPSRVVGGS